MRFILFLLFVIAAYYLIKGYFKRLFSGSITGGSVGKGPKKKMPPVIDELVQDPVCKVYVPKKEALVYGRKGKLYYFCCKECLERFKDNPSDFV